MVVAPFGGRILRAREAHKRAVPRIDRDQARREDRKVEQAMSRTE